jgi:hypothetical protein
VQGDARQFMVGEYLEGETQRLGSEPLIGQQGVEAVRHVQRVLSGWLQ